MNRTPAKEFRATRLVFISVVAFVFLFVMAAVFFVQWRGPLEPGLKDYREILPWITAAISLVLLIAAKKIFNKTIAIAKDSLIPLGNRLGHYRTALVKYLALCEAAALLNIILFIFTEEFLFLMFSAVLLGFMLAMMPSRRRVVAELNLDTSQERELMN